MPDDPDTPQGPELGQFRTPLAPPPQSGVPTEEDPNAVEVLTLNDERVVQRRTFSPGVARPQSYTDREKFLREWRG